MASPGAEQIQAMINDSIRAAVADLDNRFGALLGQQVSVQDAKAAMKLIVDDAKAEFEGSRQRINDLCSTNNDTFAEHRRVIEAIVADFNGSSATLAQSTTAAQADTKTLGEELTRLRRELQTEFDSRTESLAIVRKEMSDWADQHKVTVMTMLQQGGGGGSMDQGKGQGQGQAQGGKGPSIDKKEVSVWKLPDQVTKQEFRHWLDAVDTYLSAAQNFEFPEVVLDRVRRHPDEVNQSNWAALMTSANAEVPRNKKID